MGPDPKPTLGATPAVKVSIEEQLNEAQLKLIQKRTELLEKRLERKPRYDILIRLFQLATPLAALGTLAFGIQKDYDRRVAESHSAQVQKDKDGDAAAKELMRPWIELQRTTYCQALADASTFINAAPADEARAKGAMEDFLQLYNGTMCVVETKEVCAAMVALWGAVEEQKGKDELNGLCHALATKMESSMHAATTQSLADFTDDQFKYGDRPLLGAPSKMVDNGSQFK